MAENKVPTSTLVVSIIALVSICITIYTIGTSKADDVRLQSMKNRVDAYEKSWSIIKGKDIPALQAFDAGVAETLKHIQADFTEMKTDIKAILDILMERSER